MGNKTHRSLLLVVLDSVRDVGLLINVMIVLIILAFVVGSVLQRNFPFTEFVPAAYSKFAILGGECALAMTFSLISYFSLSKNFVGSLFGGGLIGLSACALGMAIRAMFGSGNSSSNNTPDIKPNGSAYTEIRL